MDDGSIDAIVANVIGILISFLIIIVPLIFIL
jgi:hypothetical protein